MPTLTKNKLLRIILIPFLIHWTWLLWHYADAMWYMIGLGWNMVDVVPTVYLVVQSWVLLSEIMVMVILVLLAQTFKSQSSPTSLLSSDAFNLKNIEDKGAAKE